MIRLSTQDRARPVQLLGQHQARELVRESERREGETMRRPRKQILGQPPRISSISKAARIVSMSTVARTVPRSNPSSSSAVLKTSCQSSASSLLSSFGRYR